MSQAKEGFKIGPDLSPTQSQPGPCLKLRRAQVGRTKKVMGETTRNIFGGNPWWRGPDGGGNGERACKYHTSNDVFSRCKSVHKMATGKSDDELIQLDNKMRI